MTTRRTFVSSLAGAGVALAFEPVKPLAIRAVDVIRVDGHREEERGVNRQFQANPLHIYDELRPKPYRDGARSVVMSPVSDYYVNIKAEGDHEGLYGPIDKEACIVVQQQLRPFLLGKDALAGEKLWDQMFRSDRLSRRGHYLMAISAVDNTLWDLRGRYFNTPVYRLLGGPTRANVEAYVSCLGYSLEPEAARQRAIAFKAEGFRYQKWFLAYGPGDGPAGMQKNVEIVRILREAVGDDTDLMFDVFQGWSLDYALEWAKQVERYRPHWIEEAIPAEKFEAFAELRRGTAVPIASGEHIQGRWELQNYLKAGALNVVQCDPEWCGGISELQKICALASLYDVPVIPHGHSIHAALHVIASQSPATCPLLEYLWLKMAGYHHFEKNPPTLRRAHMDLPSTPGFGIELDPAKVEKREVAVWS